jgi:translocation and assembly module TamB
VSRARKWLVVVFASAGALLVAVAIALAWLLYTPSGLRFALDRAAALTHGDFAYASADGTLAGSATLTGLRYRDADGLRLAVASATVALRPWALLQRQLRVTRARVAGIELDLAPATPSNAANTTFSLQPPLAFILRDTQLARIVVRRDGQPLFAADSLAIDGAWTRRRLLIRRLELRAPAGHAALDGTLAIAKGHAGRGTARFAWTQGDAHYAGEATAQSDGRVAKLHAALTAPAALTLEASMRLDAARAWTVAVDAPTFDARALPALPSSLKALALDLRGSGDAHGGALHGNVALNGTTLTLDPAAFRYAAGTLTLAPLRLRSPEIPGDASLIGTINVNAAPMAFALDARWHDVELPADLVGQPMATHGELHAEGTLDRYALKGALAIGPQDRVASLTVDASGTPHALDIRALRLVQGNGGLTASGRVELAAPLRWRLKADARRFDPGALVAGWNGALDFRLATDGSLGKDGPTATLALSDASGTLRGRRIAGSRADLKTTPRNLLSGSATLVAGASRIELTGKGGARTDAAVAVNVASLGDWLPGAAGSLRGRFTLKGSWPRLAVAGELQGHGLHTSGGGVDALQLAASVPDLSRPGGSLRLDLRGVHTPGLDFTAIAVDGDGTAAAHHLRLHARGPRLDAVLMLAGRWQANTRRWSGSVTQLELTPHGIPAWRQRQPAAITWQHGAFTLAPLCLGTGAAQACLSAKRDARGTLTIDYRLQALPLQLLAALAPLDPPLVAHGEISGTGRFARTASGAINGDGALEVTPGQLALVSRPDQPLLAWNSLTLDASARGATQHLRLAAALAAGGSIHGTVAVAGPQRALNGVLGASVKRLAFLEALSPELANVNGVLAGSLTLGGTLSAPTFEGRIATDDFSAELPRAGLKLHGGRFSVTGDSDGRLAITGDVASGEGTLHVDGHAGLGAGSVLDLAVKGDRVLVADIPAARVVASPDLAITRSGNTFRVTGSVAIPEARIEAEKLPGQGPAQASPDVVIVDAPPPEAVTPLAMEADLQIQLGDKVKVQGYGLDGSVSGRLGVHVQPGKTATGRGEIRVAGKYQAYGQNLTIQQGRLLFAGTRLDNPGLDIRAVRSIRSQSVTVGLSIRGTAQRPVLTVFSDPTMEQAEALSYLVTGRPLNALKSGEGDTLDTAAQARGGLAGDRIAKSIGSRLGLEAGVSSSEALGGSAFTTGKYLSPRLFLSYGVGLFTPGQVVTLRYTLNRFLQFEAENATTGTRASFNYRIEK